jgi:hypothetical protein
VLKSDFKLSHARQITANAAYIVYGLRAGQLRCINKATAGRALYRGHAAPIADAAFFSWESNLLASASAAGDLFVRLVVEADGNPQAAPVMRASLAAPPPDAPARLAWHPLEPRILAAGSGGTVSLFMVPGEAAAPASEASDAAAAALPATAASWELPLGGGGGGGAAAALAFSPAGDVLVAGGSDGAAIAWALDAALSAPGGGAPPAALRWPATGPGGGAVAAAVFLSQAAPGAPALLVTGDATNRALRLWRLPGVAALAAGAAAQPLQTLELASVKGPSDFFCHLGHSPRAALLLLANAKRNQVHALHYRVAEENAEASGDEGDSGGPTSSIDYVATFSVKQPVLSFAAGYEVTESEATPGQMEGHVQLYCVQPDAVQQYTLNPALCTPGPEDGPSATAGGEHGASAAPAESAADASADAADDATSMAAADGGAPMPPAVLPSPVRLLHKESLGKDSGVVVPATAAATAEEQQQAPAPALEEQQPEQQHREPSPPPLPSTLGQQQGAADKVVKQQAAGEEKAAAAAAAVASSAHPAPQPQQQPKQKKQKQGGGSGGSGSGSAPASAPAGLASLTPPAGMPPLPTTLAGKAGGGHDKGASAALSREASQEVRPAVAPTVSVTPMPGSGCAAPTHARGGGAGRVGSEELEEGEIPPGALAAAAAAEEVAALRRAVERLAAGQAGLAAAVRAEVAEGLRAAEGAAGARAEAAVVKALAKRAEDDKRRGKELEKTLGQQISQVGAGPMWKGRRPCLGCSTPCLGRAPCSAGRGCARARAAPGRARQPRDHGQAAAPRLTRPAPRAAPKPPGQRTAAGGREQDRCRSGARAGARRRAGRRRDARACAHRVPRARADRVACARAARRGRGRSRACGRGRAAWWRAAGGRRGAVRVPGRARCRGRGAPDVRPG